MLKFKRKWNQHFLPQTLNPLLKVYILYSHENINIFGQPLNGNNLKPIQLIKM